MGKSYWDRLNVGRKELIVGAIIGVILLGLGILFYTLPLDTTFLSSIQELFVVFAVVPFLALFNSFFGLIFPVIYVYILSIYLSLAIKKKINKHNTLFFVLSSVAIVILGIIGVVITIAHPI